MREMSILRRWREREERTAKREPFQGKEQAPGRPEMTVRPVQSPGSRHGTPGQRFRTMHRPSLAGAAVGAQGPVSSAPPGDSTLPEHSLGSRDPHEGESELKPKPHQPPRQTGSWEPLGPPPPEDLTFHGEHPSAKVLEVDSPQVVGIQILHEFFHLWEGRRDRREAPRTPQSWGEAGQGRGLVT